MLTHGALIAFIVVAIKYISALKPNKEQIIEKGIDGDLFDIYIMIVGLFNTTLIRHTFANSL